MVIANPTPLSSKSRYWQNDLNQPILVIEREFFFENPREIATKAFHENFHYPFSDLLKTRGFYEHICETKVWLISVLMIAKQGLELMIIFQVCLDKMIFKVAITKTNQIKEKS